MTEALVTPKIIQWARERYHLAAGTFAQKLNISPDKLEAWENGEERPTFKQAQTLAQKLHIPFGYLFLSVPPQEKLPLPDFRTVAGAEPRAPSPDFADLLNDILRKQDWYREYQENEGAVPISFVGRFTINDKPEIIAADIRNTLSIDDNMREKSENWESFLRDFISKADDAGVLVFRSSVVGNSTRRKLDVDEFRGFAISDRLAPVVFLNGEDAKAAQIFTLAHELAHLWIGESGISNPDYQKRSFQQQHIIDRFCDQVAAETLVPREDFVPRWQDKKPLEENLRTLAIRYRVSEFVILRRAYEIEKLSREEYIAQYQEHLLNHRAGPAKKGGGDFHRSLLARNSKTLTVTLLAATAGERISHRDAARLLNVKIKTLPAIVRVLKERGLLNA